MAIWHGMELEISSVILIVRVLQRNRTNCVGRCVCVNRFYCKEWAQVIMETSKSQDLQGESANWRPRRANDLSCSLSPKDCEQGKLMVEASVWRLVGSRPRRSRYFSLSPKAGKSLCPSLKATGQKEFFPSQGRSTFLFCSWLHQIGWDSPTLGRAICFTLSVDSNVNLIWKHCHRHTRSNVWPNFWVPCGLIRVTHKIQCHRDHLVQHPHLMDETIVSDAVTRPQCPSGQGGTSVHDSSVHSPVLFLPDSSVGAGDMLMICSSSPVLRIRLTLLKEMEETMPRNEKP